MDSKESELFMKSSLEEKIQQTNDAILAKEKSELRQEAAEKEIARLHERVQTLNLKYRENAETQINTIKAQYTAEKRRLTDEIITLETSRSKMQNTMERAIREKRSVEAQLEKLANNIPSETERISNILQDLSSRLSIAQSDSARAVSKMESIHQKYLRLQNTSDKEKQQLLDVNQESYKRLRVLESDHLQSKEEAVNLTRQLSVLDHAFKNTKEQLQKMEIQHEHDLKTISSKYEATIEDLTLKLSEKTNNCSRISSDLQKLLVEQSNMSLKWKDESKSITDHFNSLVIDLKANNTRLDSQINTLEDRVQLLTLKKQDFENQLMVEKKNCARLVVEIQNQKAAADGANQRILHFMAREAEILDEKKQIERNFDRLVLEKERLERDARKPAARANTRPVDFRDHKVDALWAEVNRVKNRTAKAQYVVDISADNSDDDV